MGCVYMPPMAVAEEEQHYAALMEDIRAFQEKGQMVVLGDFNARVGSAADNFDVIGRFGETHTNASGQRLIQLLHGTGMYALNGRVPCMQPAWTCCRMSRSEQSILDYILGNTDCFSSAPPVRVFQADVSDHYLVHIAFSRRALLLHPGLHVTGSMLGNCKTCMSGRLTVHTWHHTYHCLLRGCNNCQLQMTLDLRSLFK